MRNRHRHNGFAVVFRSPAQLRPTSASATGRRGSTTLIQHFRRSHGTACLVASSSGEPTYPPSIPIPFWSSAPAIVVDVLLTYILFDHEQREICAANRADIRHRRTALDHQHRHLDERRRPIVLSTATFRSGSSGRSARVAAFGMLIGRRRASASRGMTSFWRSFHPEPHRRTRSPSPRRLSTGNLIMIVRVGVVFVDYSCRFAVGRK